MQSLSLRLGKRLSDASKPHWRISPNLLAHASTTSSSPSPPSTPISAASTLNNLLSAPWSASQTRGLTFSGSHVPPHSVAGYATVAATTEDDIKRKERNSGLRNQGIKTKREQLLKVTAVVPLLLVYPNAYSLLAANFFVFWHINAGIEEILADYVHHEMTREFIFISLRLFLIIAIKDVFLNFVFV
ncbi:succinate dehydrogenase subunit 4, mitochondrial-like [Vicia villosa]|uniref:succinate dehydrogenase subunit 4, mitochondrial-like n=1 Tax=Vicia villosa TaxID=3911 RepID=UPI00273B1683|nr:succinate dehydrogenase subunit 4, mitochondrial-like [Vicia villosa]